MKGNCHRSEIRFSVKSRHILNLMLRCEYKPRHLWQASLSPVQTPNKCFWWRSLCSAEEIRLFWHYLSISKLLVIYQATWGALSVCKLILNILHSSMSTFPKSGATSTVLNVRNVFSILASECFTGFAHIHIHKCRTILPSFLLMPLYSLSTTHVGIG